MMYRIILVAVLVFYSFALVAQAGGLEDIIVEKYYISDADDATDTLSKDTLNPGSVTYRIYVDMAPEYKLQMVYGIENHPLIISTTTDFFNSQRGGQMTAERISMAKIKEGTNALDSWITIGCASQNHIGVLKRSDSDGSIVGGKNNDGGSKQIKGGLLKNSNSDAGIPLTDADGMIEGPIKTLVFYNLEPIAFAGINNGEFRLDDNVWAVLEGVVGPTKENQVLIAQITTNGELSFEINVQLLAPYGGGERYNARNVDESDFHHPALIYPKVN